MSTMGDVQYRGRQHDKCGDLLSTVGDVMMNVGGYHEYRGGVQYLGGYHDTCGQYDYRGGLFHYCGGTQMVKDCILRY